MMPWLLVDDEGQDPNGDQIIAIDQHGEYFNSLISNLGMSRFFQLRVKANDIAQQLTLPLPLSAQGDVELSILQADINLKSTQCITVKGTTSWSKASVVALEQNIKLGDLNADVRCEKGVLALIISPKNDLGLTFSAYVNKGGKLSGKGYLTPGAKFPQVLNQALPFLGSKDNQGRYRFFLATLF
jgi:general secretion pathway protein N